MKKTILLLAAMLSTNVSANAPLRRANTQFLGNYHADEHTNVTIDDALDAADAVIQSHIEADEYSQEYSIFNPDYETNTTMGEALWACDAFIEYQGPIHEYSYEGDEMHNNIMLELPYDASETDLVNKLGETLQNTQPDTKIKITHSGIGHQELQIYQHPNDETILVRVKTGGHRNMCPLLSLGALPVNSREEAEMLIRQIIAGIKLLAATTEPIILLNPQQTSPTLAQWKERDITSIPDDIFDSEFGINYERLWCFLHGIKSNNAPEMIVDDDPLWWPVIAQVLNANIHFFHIFQQDGLIHSHNVIIPEATREIYIAARPGHYTMLLPPNPQQIVAEMRRNLPYNPIF